MHLSDALATLNVARYEAWRPRFTAKQCQAGGAGLQRRRVRRAGRENAQAGRTWPGRRTHLCILSGLYGVLRPLDRMQPYRLEMGTKLATAHGDNLYQFWGSRIAEYLNQRLAGDRTPVVVNLASQEYFKAVDRKVLKGARDRMRVRRMARAASTRSSGSLPSGRAA